MHRREWDSKIMFTIGSILSLLIFGLFDSLKGSTISALLGEMKFNYSLGGTIVMGQYAGYFVATFVAGTLIDYCGHKAALIFAGFCMLLGVAGYAAVSTISLLLLFIFFMGMGLGTLELTGSNIITIYYPEKKGRYLNILTAIAGIGAVLSPIIVSSLFNEGFSWRAVYYLGLVIILPTTIYFIFIKNSSKDKNSHIEKGISERKEKNAVIEFFEVRFLLMYLANFMYMAAEMGIATWIVEFYMKEAILSSTNSARFLSLFYIGMTSGRIIGSAFVDKWGRYNSAVLASAGSAACILLGIIGTPILSAFIAVSGLFCSIIFPTNTAIISSLPKGDSGRIQGIYFACGGLGGMFGPWIMGGIGDFWGIKWSMILGGTFFIGVALTLVALKRTIAKN